MNTMCLLVVLSVSSLSLAGLVPTLPPTPAPATDPLLRPSVVCSNPSAGPSLAPLCSDTRVAVLDGGGRAVLHHLGSDLLCYVTYQNGSTSNAWILNDAYSGPGPAPIISSPAMIRTNEGFMAVWQQTYPGVNSSIVARVVSMTYGMPSLYETVLSDSDSPFNMEPYLLGDGNYIYVAWTASYNGNDTVRASSNATVSVSRTYLVHNNALSAKTGVEATADFSEDVFSLYDSCRACGVAGRNVSTQFSFYIDVHYVIACESDGAPMAQVFVYVHHAGVTSPYNTTFEEMLVPKATCPAVGGLGDAVLFGMYQGNGVALVCSQSTPEYASGCGWDVAPPTSAPRTALPSGTATDLPASASPAVATLVPLTPAPDTALPTATPTDLPAGVAVALPTSPPDTALPSGTTDLPAGATLVPPTSGGVDECATAPCGKGETCLDPDFDVEKNFECRCVGGKEVSLGAPMKECNECMIGLFPCVGPNGERETCTDPDTSPESMGDFVCECPNHGAKRTGGPAQCSTALPSGNPTNLPAGVTVFPPTSAPRSALPSGTATDLPASASPSVATLVPLTPAPDTALPTTDPPASASLVPPTSAPDTALPTATPTDLPAGATFAPPPPPAVNALCTADKDCRSGRLDPKATCNAGTCVCHTQGYVHPTGVPLCLLADDVTVPMAFAVEYYGVEAQSLWTTATTRESFEGTMSEALGIVTDMRVVVSDGGVLVVGMVRASTAKLADALSGKEDLTAALSSEGVSVSHGVTCASTDASYTVQYNGVCNAVECEGNTTLTLADGTYTCESDAAQPDESGGGSNIVLYVGLGVAAACVAALCCQQKGQHAKEHENPLFEVPLGEEAELCPAEKEAEETLQLS